MDIKNGKHNHHKSQYVARNTMKCTSLQSPRNSIPWLVVCCKSVRIILAISLTFLYSSTILWQHSQQQPTSLLHGSSHNFHNNHHQTNPTEWHLRSFQQKIIKVAAPALSPQSTQIIPVTQIIEQHQRNCTLDVGEFRFRNRYGMGSDLHLWAQALCNSLQESVRLWTVTPWIFRDEQVCGRHSNSSSTDSEPFFLEDPSVSAMECYFPGSETAGCPTKENVVTRKKKLYSGKGRIHHSCQPWLDKHNITYSEFNQAAMEYLYARLAPIIHETAQPWMRKLFGSSKNIPSSLITVHVRWGDKSREMKIVEINEYIRAVQQLVEGRERQDDTDTDSNQDSVHVFLATEDPAAAQAFRQEMPSHWKLYVDPTLAIEESNRINATNGHARQAYYQEGRPGLHALASLWIALQARDFVLTTASNWSRLINEWRLASSKETRMVDLRPFVVE